MPEIGSTATATSAMSLATTGQRFGTWVIDFVCYFVFALLIGVSAGLVGLADVLQRINNFVLGIGILFVYYFPQEVMGGRTIGKRIMKTEAVSEDGTPLTPKQAFLRTVCRCIPFEAFSFLGGKGHPKGWHDRFAKTKVVSLR